MAYTTKIIKDITSAQKTEGNMLGRHALRIGFSVIRVAKATGATRQSVYNWFVGKPIAPYYKAHVDALLKVLTASDTSEQAWRETCKRFNLKS
jgi:hypothetical protein